MKERFNFAIGLLVGLFLAGVALTVLIILWGRIYPLPYQTPIPIVIPAAAPADMGELTTRVKNLEDTQTYNIQVFQWDLDQKLLIFGWLALFITLAAGAVGIKTYSDLDRVIKERVDKLLDKELYQLDPANIPIHLYSGRVNRTQGKKKPETKTVARNEMKKIAERLKMTGLQNVGGILRLDKVSRKGITIIPIDDPDDEREFIQFVSNAENELDTQKAGFILYAPVGYKVDTLTLNAFPNVVTANMPPTAANMVLVIGRGLKNRED